MYFGFKRNRRVVILVELKGVDIKEVPKVDMDVVTGVDMEYGEVDPILILIVVI
jgi:hypothetical protein